tara:strand:+ start:88 stop:192 length:105 start_codon:yes stop_codon:yes gene_type:complete
MDVKITINEIPKENIIVRKQVSIVDGELEILEEE